MKKAVVGALSFVFFIAVIGGAVANENSDIVRGYYSEGNACIDGMVYDNGVSPLYTKLPLKEDAIALNNYIRPYLSEKGYEAYIDIIVSMCYQESSYGTYVGVRNGIPYDSNANWMQVTGYTGPGGIESVKAGVDHFIGVIKECINKGCTDIYTLVQAYNYGNSYIGYVMEHGGADTAQLRVDFQTAHNKGSGYGDASYCVDVMKRCIGQSPELAGYYNGEIYDKSTGDLDKDLASCANWYIQNVTTYQQSTSGKGTGSRKRYLCPLDPTGYAGDDCTGFAVFFMRYVAGTTKIGDATSEMMIDANNSWSKNVQKYGWKRYKASQIGSVKKMKPGDVMVAYKKGAYHHAEIYLSPKTTFGWGKIRTEYPVSNSITYKNGGFSDSSHVYTVIYRYEGDDNAKN